MSTLCLLNGEAADRISMADRAFQFGDGVFRTLRLQEGAIPHWQRHFRKLCTDAAALGIHAPEAAVWLDDIRQLGLRDAALKLILTRGETPRGYAWPAGLTPNRVVQAHANQAPLAIPKTGVKVCICSTPATWQPRLAGVKHLNRLENVLARAEIQQAGCFEGLLLGRDGEVVEGSMSNVLLYTQSELVTPLLDSSGVQGVMREVAMQAASGLGYLVSERRVSLADVNAAERIWLCNSVMGLVPVAQIESRGWPAHVLDMPFANAIAKLARDELFTL